MVLLKAKRLVILFVISEVTVGFIVKKSIEREEQFLLTGLCKLHICQSPEIFKYAAALFILECLDDDDEQVVDFIHHFKLEWIDQNI